MASENVSTLHEALDDASLPESEDAPLFEELARAHAAEAAGLKANGPVIDRAKFKAETPPAPTGGGRPYGVTYYFTTNVGTDDDPIYHTHVREVALPVDAVVECVGNTLVIRHEGVADTFRIGRVRPLEA